MASTDGERNSDGSDDSSDDECLSVIKRKVERVSRNKAKKPRNDVESDSDEGRLLTEMMVTVEVEELDDTHAFNFSNKQTSPLDMSKKKKKKKKDKLDSKSKLQKRGLKAKVQKYFTCRTCEATFNTSEELKTHSLEHQVKTRHHCEECNRYFKKAFSLRIHMRAHMGNMVKCPICNEGFPMPVNLGKHLRTMHTKDVECDKCPEKFFTQKQLDEHYRKHNREKHQTSIKIENSENFDDSNDANNSSFEHNESYTSREDLSHPTQCAIVTKMHKGRSVADICRIYNLKPEIVEQIWEEREKYTLEKKAGKQTIRLLNNMLDTRIIEWFETQRANDVQVSGQMLQDVAETFAKECGFVAFNGSKKWLDRFKSRYNILLRGTPRKKDPNASMESKWKTIFFTEQWCDVRMGIDDNDIYCADEVGFYYKPSKGRVRKLGGKKYIQGHAEDRLAVFLCANVPGTDKKKLLVCGTEDPLLRSHRDPNTLPVSYIRHTQAHFTTQMFEEYVRYWNRELQVQNKKALLILDRVTIHSKLQLSHLKLVFVPWKACNTLIPIKAGIFSRFRDEFRRVFLEEKAMNVLRGIDRNFTCLEALYMLGKAWDRTPAYVINNGFIQTGYDVTPLENEENHTPKVTENDEEILCNIIRDYDTEVHYHDPRDANMYLTVDEELLTGQGTNCSVFGGNHKVTDPLVFSEPDKDILPLGTEKPETNEREDVVTKLRVLQDLEIVKNYLYSSDTSYQSFSSFLAIENFVSHTMLSSHIEHT
ncbi:hypothetical protein K1T71_000957 [Dendrolimus kikuchii]|uniref:Uncharacterized protein n=1 Tax=Dendrolimus kikuchii TaxID=765133 RepID=A0ACC1DGG0_9NEOP|nr:hypothetical protein K1T71_000957 [Dendrolimus kikuchii]